MIKPGDKFKDSKTGNSYRVKAVNCGVMILEVEAGPNQVLNRRNEPESSIRTLVTAKPRMVIPFCIDSLNESIPQAADAVSGRKVHDYTFFTRSLLRRKVRRWMHI